MNESSRQERIIRTSVVGILVNLLIAAVKIMIGTLASSIAIVSEGINNATDAGSSFLTYIGTKLSGKHPDEKHPFGYGRIIRDEKGLSKIVEQKDATEEEQAVKEVNSGMYIFKCDALLAALSQITNDNAQGEYYLPDTIEIIKKMGLPVDAAAMEDADQIKGVNTLEQLAEAEEIMRSR